MVYAIERVIEKEKLDAKVEIVREMIKEGDSIDKISRITKLSVAEIEKIAKGLSN